MFFCWRPHQGGDPVGTTRLPLTTTSIYGRSQQRWYRSSGERPHRSSRERLHGALESARAHARDTLEPTHAYRHPRLFRVRPYRNSRAWVQMYSRACGRTDALKSSERSCRSREGSYTSAPESACTEALKSAGTEAPEGVRTALWRARAFSRLLRERRYRHSREHSYRLSGEHASVRTFSRASDSLGQPRTAPRQPPTASHSLGPRESVADIRLSRAASRQPGQLLAASATSGSLAQP